MAAQADAAAGSSHPHGASGAPRPSWRAEPQEALERLAASQPRPLGGRPGGWGDSSPVLLAPLGELEIVGGPLEVPYGTPERRALEVHALRGLFFFFFFFLGFKGQGPHRW